MLAPGRPVLVSALVAALVAAGCIEDGEGDADEVPPGGEGGDIVAYMDAPEERGANRTILLLREGGAAERLTYIADGSWAPRLAPGLEYAPSDLSLLFTRAGATVERGGLVTRIEQGALPTGSLAALEPFLVGEWPEPFLPPGEEPHPWYRPVFLVRAQPLTSTQLPPDGTQHLSPEDARLGELWTVFEGFARTFEAEDVEELVIPQLMSWEGCLRATTTTARPAAPAGETIEVFAEVMNCGQQPATIDPARCREPPFATVQIGSRGAAMFAVLPASTTPTAAYALDLVCRDEDGVLQIPAGGAASFTRRWNGTFATCTAADTCEYRPAPPGQYEFYTFTSGDRGTAPASVTLYAADEPTTRLLLVREFDWVNTTSGGHIQGNFGPHCAPVAYTTDPATVTLWYYETKPVATPALVVRDWRAGERPANAVTFSADRLDVELFWNGTAAIDSPFDDALALTNVTLREEGFDIGGVLLAQGETHTVRFEHTFERDGATFETVSILEFEHLGEAPVLFARAGGCL